ncbi:hypothetical protein [Salinispora arenicola]|uniref:hypothetical protein n=1 Tax=Salinispora arenicola TaxID=168697 RepID=UPI0027DEA65C|nr:hypothetical protein [Salinispora arenicola]
MFSDLGTRPDYRQAPATLFLDNEREISCDGGLDDLLAEAVRPDRRFGFVISTDVHRLSCDTVTRTALLRAFAVAGIEFLHVPEIRDGDRLPVMPWRLRSVDYIKVLTQLIRDAATRDEHPARMAPPTRHHRPEADDTGRVPRTYLRPRSSRSPPCRSPGS